ncbi:ABC transporter permease [Staphylococcus warneri]|uniref:ABC transporter permease n=2 Tax=Staphylococcus warneri TaxID=1292 RepID=UPI000D1D20E4|nr:ABC transporter permease [Staphylococcus warneri]PTI26349.1 ABC transporter permease [Staphylococcus warneri]RIM99571.1 ABC transporter permease [Staphylococcus warneri]RIN04322.1 ABC transporter permease [Staphylococcus warneri]
MNKFFKSFQFTYFGKIMSKSFIIITLILVMLVILAFNADKISDLSNDKETIGLVTKNKDIYTEIKKEKNEFFNKDVSIKHYSNSEAEKKLKSKEIDYILNISISNNVSGKLKSKDQPSSEMEKNVKNLLNTIQYKLSLNKLHLNKNQVKSLNQESHFSTQVIHDKGKLKQKEKDFQLVFTIITLTLMVFIIMNYVNQIAMEVAIEKTSRVIETIITSIRPSIHITAKILGVFAVALTQIIILLITILICIAFFDVHTALDKLNLEVSYASTDLLLYNFIFWIIGIISYSLISSILGSLTSRIEDIGQSLMPLLLILLSSFYIVMFSINNPNNTFVNISSYIPLFSPFTMLFRIANHNVNTVQILISIIISVIFVVVCFIIATRSYKSSVLTYDKNIFKVIKKIRKRG